MERYCLCRTRFVFSGDFLFHGDKVDGGCGFTVFSHKFIAFFRAWVIVEGNTGWDHINKGKAMNIIDLPVSATDMHVPNCKRRNFEYHKWRIWEFSERPWQRQQLKEAVERVTIDRLPMNSKRRWFENFETMIGDIVTSKNILSKHIYGECTYFDTFSQNCEGGRIPVV